MTRILIAEDDRKIAELERDYLEINGYETRLIEEGTAVIPALKAEHFDLLFTGCYASGMRRI